MKNEDGHIQISFGEKFTRMFKKHIQKIDKYFDDDKYTKELSLYDKSQQIQTARYIVIDKNSLRKRDIDQPEEEESEEESSSESDS